MISWIGKLGVLHNDLDLLIIGRCPVSSVAYPVILSKERNSKQNKHCKHKHQPETQSRLTHIASPLTFLTK
jgi:hypothetical protein